MSPRCTVIIEDPDWRLASVGDQGVELVCLPSAEGADVRAQARAVAEKITEIGGSRSVVLAIPSAWCLSALIQTDAVGRSGRRQALAYLLEEHLPFSAEDAAVDFIEADATALGVAVELRQLRPIVQALREVDITVRHICPLAILAAADLAEGHASARTLCCATSAGIDLIQVEQGTPTRWWWWFLPDRGTASDALSAWVRGLGDTPGHAIILGQPIDLAGVECIAVPSEPPATEQSAIDRAAAARAARQLDGQAWPWVDLCRGELAPTGRYAMLHKSVGLLVAGVVLLLICTGAATYWRSMQYAELADDLQSQQITVFKTLMPDQRVPPDIFGRLQSEKRRLAGPGPQAGDTSEQELLYPTSALSHLQRLLTVWPEDSRCRLSDLTIEPGLILLNGEAADSVIPEQLVASLRATGEYQVDEPNSRALRDDGYSFSFSARAIVKPLQADAATRSQP